MKSLSLIWLFVTGWTIYSPPGSSIYWISRREHWMGLPFSSPGDLLNPEIELKSPSLQTGSLSASLVAQGKESACNVGHLGSISGLGKSPGEGNGYPLQYSGLESMGFQRVRHNWMTFALLLWLCNYYSLNVIVSWLVNRK